MTGHTSARQRRSEAVEVLRARLRESDRVAVVVCPVVLVLLILGAWQWLSTSGIVNEILLPAPTDVIDSLLRLANTYFFWEAAWVTTQEALIGFVLGVFVGWALGTLIGMFRIAYRAFYPIIVATQLVPHTAFAPVFITWFGFGMASKYTLAAAICFFPVLINVVHGLETVNKDARALMRSLGASRWEEYRKLLFPASLPAIFAALKIAITFALVGAVVAEFVGADEGMAVLIKTFNFQLLVAEGFAVILALSILGLVLYGLTVLLEARVVFWRQH
jgi:NitT/TauT family transport system permease protein